MYNFLTAFVTVSVLVFIAIYNTSFIPVVTLGGTVLGSALIGFCSVLLVFVLRKLVRVSFLRQVMETAGSCCVIVGTAGNLPGWQLHFGMGAVFFLLLLCAAVTAVSEYTLDG